MADGTWERLMQLKALYNKESVDTKPKGESDKSGSSPLPFGGSGVSSLSDSGSLPTKKVKTDKGEKKKDKERDRDLEDEENLTKKGSSKLDTTSAPSVADGKLKRKRRKMVDSDKLALLLWRVTLDHGGSCHADTLAEYAFRDWQLLTPSIQTVTTTTVTSTANINASASKSSASSSSGPTTTTEQIQTQIIPSRASLEDVKKLVHQALQSPHYLPFHMLYELSNPLYLSKPLYDPALPADTSQSHPLSRVSVATITSLVEADFESQKQASETGNTQKVKRELISTPNAMDITDEPTSLAESKDKAIESESEEKKGESEKQKRQEINRRLALDLRYVQFKPDALLDGCYTLTSNSYVPPHITGAADEQMNSLVSVLLPIMETAAVAMHLDKIADQVIHQWPQLTPYGINNANIDMITHAVHMTLITHPKFEREGSLHDECFRIVSQARRRRAAGSSAGLTGTSITPGVTGAASSKSNHHGTSTSKQPHHHHGHNHHGDEGSDDAVTHTKTGRGMGASANSSTGGPLSGTAGGSSISSSAANAGAPAGRKGAAWQSPSASSKKDVVSNSPSVPNASTSASAAVGSPTGANTGVSSSKVSKKDSSSNYYDTGSSSAPLRTSTRLAEAAATSTFTSSNAGNASALSASSNPLGVEAILSSASNITTSGSRAKRKGRGGTATSNSTSSGNHMDIDSKDNSGGQPSGWGHFPASSVTALAVASIASSIHPSIASDCGKFYGSVKVLTARLRPGPGYSCIGCKTKSSTRWFHGPGLDDWHCATCGIAWSSEHTCPICGLVYENDDDDLHDHDTDEEEEIEEEEEEEVEEVDDQDEEEEDVEDAAVAAEDDEEADHEGADEDAAPAADNDKEASMDASEHVSAKKDVQDQDDDDEDDENDEDRGDDAGEDSKPGTPPPNKKAKRLDSNASDSEVAASKGSSTASTTNAALGSTASEEHKVDEDAIKRDLTLGVSTGTSSSSTGDNGIVSSHDEPSSVIGGPATSTGGSAMDLDASSLGTGAPSASHTHTSNSDNEEDEEDDENGEDGDGDGDGEGDEDGDDLPAPAGRRKRKRRKSTFRKSTYPKASKNKAKRAAKSLNSSTEALQNIALTSSDPVASSSGLTSPTAKSSSKKTLTSSTASAGSKTPINTLKKSSAGSASTSSGAASTSSSIKNDPTTSAKDKAQAKKGGVVAKKGSVTTKKSATGSSSNPSGSTNNTPKSLLKAQKKKTILSKKLQAKSKKYKTQAQKKKAAAAKNASSGQLQSSWIACDDCNRWVMSGCDGISDLSLYDDSNPNHIDYRCSLCRGSLDSAPSVFYTKATAKFFVGDLKEVRRYVSTGPFVKDMNAMTRSVVSSSFTSSTGIGSNSGEGSEAVGNVDSTFFNPSGPFSGSHKEFSTAASSSTAASPASSTASQRKGGTTSSGRSTANTDTKSSVHTPGGKGAAKGSLTHASSSSANTPLGSSPTGEHATRSGTANARSKSVAAATSSSSANTNTSSPTAYGGQAAGATAQGWSQQSAFGASPILAPVPAHPHSPYPAHTPITIPYGIQAANAPVFVLNARLAQALDPNLKFARVEQEMLRLAETIVLTQQQQLKSSFDAAMTLAEEQERANEEATDSSSAPRPQNAPSNSNSMEIDAESVSGNPEAHAMDGKSQTGSTQKSQSPSSGQSRPLPPLSEKSKHTLALLEQRFQEEVLNMRSLLANSMAHMMDQHRLDSERSILILLQEREAMDSRAETMILEQFQAFAALKTQQLLSKTLALYQQDCPALATATLPSMQAESSSSSSAQTSAPTSSGNGAASVSPSSAVTSAAQGPGHSVSTSNLSNTSSSKHNDTTENAAVHTDADQGDSMEISPPAPSAHPNPSATLSEQVAVASASGLSARAPSTESSSVDVEIPSSLLPSQDPHKSQESVATHTRALASSSKPTDPADLAVESALAPVAASTTAPIAALERPTSASEIPKVNSSTEISLSGAAGQEGLNGEAGSSRSELKESTSSTSSLSTSTPSIAITTPSSSMSVVNSAMSTGTTAIPKAPPPTPNISSASIPPPPAPTPVSNVPRTVPTSVSSSSLPPPAPKLAAEGPHGEEPKLQALATNESPSNNLMVVDKAPSDPSSPFGEVLQATDASSSAAENSEAQIPPVTATEETGITKKNINAGELANPSIFAPSSAMDIDPESTSMFPEEAYDAGSI